MRKTEARQGGGVIEDGRVVFGREAGGEGVPGLRRGVVDAVDEGGNGGGGGRGCGLGDGMVGGGLDTGVEG